MDSEQLKRLQELEEAIDDLRNRLDALVDYIKIALGAKEDKHYVYRGSF